MGCPTHNRGLRACFACAAHEAAHCRARCQELQLEVVEMEGAAARWQAQAEEVEAGLALLRFRCARGGEGRGARARVTWA